MYEASEELERFTINAWQGRAKWLWYTIIIGLGRRADETQRKCLGVVESWLRLAEPIHREHAGSSLQASRIFTR
jgi:hypothetical protein